MLCFSSLWLIYFTAGSFYFLICLFSFYTVSNGSLQFKKKHFGYNWEIEHRLGIRYYQGIVNFVVYNNAVTVMLKKPFYQL